MAHDLAESTETVWEPIEDDLLRLIFTACHPVLSREAQVALTLRVVASLSTVEIARLLVATVPAVQQRIVRAKRTLSETRVPFEVPDHTEWSARLGGVLAVIYLVFTEGHTASSGDRWVRRDLGERSLAAGPDPRAARSPRAGSTRAGNERSRAWLAHRAQNLCDN